VTLSDLLAACYDETGYQSSPAAAITTRFTRWLNEGVRAILAEPGLQRLADNDTPLQVASVASTARVVVPESVARILTISERTNDYVLRPMSLQQYRTVEPDPASTTGTPTHYVPIGRVAVATPPSDASEVFIKSTSASDGVGVTAYLEGLITSGYTRTTSTTMNGTTAKSLDTTITTWIELTDWYLSTAAVGTVTLLEDSGAGTELARITIGQKRPRYYAFYLWPTPASAVTYYVDYRRETVDLANSADEPPLPTDFHPALIAYVEMREREFKDDLQRVLIAKSRWDRWLSRLKYFTQTLGDELPVSGRGAVVGHSRLGANYPADAWRRG
jgi:hypothetical protein